MVHKITVLPGNLDIKVESGEDVLSALTKSILKVKASCGGAGTCGDCKLILKEGQIEGGGAEKLSKEEREEGYFLACKAYPASDLVVFLPPESRQGDLFEAAGNREAELSLSLLLDNWTVDPPVKKVHLKLAKPDLNDNAADLRRLKRALGTKLGVGTEIVVGLDLIRSMAKIIRQANFEITVTYLETASAIEIIRLEAGDTLKSHFGLAVDIGTTTIGLSLIDLNGPSLVTSLSGYNGQASFGDDVISRIVFAAKPGGLAKLQVAVVATITELTEKALKESGRLASEISALFMAGNTIMTHLILGIDPKYIRTEPYIPTALEFAPLSPLEMGLNDLAYARVFVIPSVASYVGGDIVSGLVASGISKSGKLTLFIDVGTNGEIVLGNSDFLVACSCSAGPAFEGGGVKDGMKATLGAIEKVEIDEATLEPSISVMGQGLPIGICGSGLIDLLGEMFLKRIIDQRGKIDQNLASNRVRMGQAGAEYVVAFSSETASGRDIVITEVDIDNLLRAKAAIFAGVQMLLSSMDLASEAIEEIIIAGSFGRYLNLEKIQIIGMLFETDTSKVHYAGNASLTGAMAASFSKEIMAEAKRVAERMTYLELSADPKFMDAYISALFLPHTNVELFPSVMERFRPKVA